MYPIRIQKEFSQGNNRKYQQLQAGNETHFRIHAQFMGMDSGTLDDLTCNSPRLVFGYFRARVPELPVDDFKARRGTQQYRVDMT